MAPYRTPLVIPFGDVDSAGIVYYPRYAHYFHQAMERFFAEALDRDYPDFLKLDGIGLPTVRLEVDYRHPLRYGDPASIGVAIERIGSRSIIWRFDVEIELPGAEEPRHTTEARVVTVALDVATFETVTIPRWLRDRMLPFRVARKS